MNEKNFIDELSSIRKLSDRFILIRSCQSNLVACDENEGYCLADGKVLFGFQNCASMEKGYCSFSVKDSPQLSDDERRFIEQYRIGHISEPLMAGFYCDVYCNAQEKKNSKYVDDIIDNYLKVIDKIERYIPADVLWVLKSLMYNCQAYKKKKKELVITAIESFLSSNVPLFFKFKLMVNARKFEFLKAAQICELSSKYQLNNKLSELYDDNESFFNMLLGCVPTKDKAQSNLIYYKLAENEESIIKKQPFDNTISRFLLKKCQYLELGGFDDEAEDCFRLYIKAKTCGQGMERVERKSYLPSFVIQEKVESIIHSQYPLLTLAMDDTLFPPINVQNDKFLSELIQMGTKVTLTDRNGNPHNGEGYYSNKALTVPDYLFIELFTIYPITLSLKTLIENGVFTANSLLVFLSHTWIGKSRLTVNQSLRDSHESWIDSLRSPITSLCAEITSEILSGGCYKGDYMYSLDSLVLKTEGCIREACWRLGINTVNPKNQDELTLEKLLEKLESFQNRHNVTIISSASLQYLRCFLTKQGKNLRNDIAHGFTSLADYSINNAIIIVLCLLRVSTMNVPTDL